MIAVSIHYNIKTKFVIVFPCEVSFKKSNGLSQKFNLCCIILGWYKTLKFYNASNIIFKKCFKTNLQLKSWKLIYEINLKGIKRTNGFNVNVVPRGMGFR